MIDKRNKAIKNSVADSELSGLVALVVDDHAPMRKAVKSILMRLGFGQVIEANDGAKAIQAMEEGFVAVVVLDLIMPRMDGFEVIAWIRNREVGMDLPIIVVTGEANKDEIIKVVDYGADDYLVKPFHPEDLERKLMRVISKYTQPTETLRLIRKAERCLFESQFEQALQLTEKTIEYDPKCWRARHLKAIALTKGDRVHESIQWLKQCIAENPDYFHFFGTLGDNLLSIGQFAEAIIAIKQELELNPKNLKRQVLIGRLLMKSLRAPESIPHFREALRENGKLASALLGMGRAYADLENVEKAIYYFKRLRRHRPKESRALEAIVRVALDANEPRRAEIVLKDEKGAHPERLDTYIVLAKFYLATDRREDALRCADELSTKHPEHIEGIQFRAELYLHFSMFKEALASFEIVKKHRLDAPVMMRIGECLLNLNRVPEAVSEFHRAIALAENPTQALAGLAEIYLRTGQPHKAYLTFATIARNGRLGPE